MLTEIEFLVPTAWDANDPNAFVTWVPNEDIFYGFPLGESFITFAAYDNATNRVETNQYITIVDTTPPVITLVGNSTVTIPLNSFYTDAGATAFDIYHGNMTSDIIANSTVNMFVPGNYTITYDVADSSGNEAVTQNRTVTVLIEEADPPTFDSTPLPITEEATGKLTILEITTPIVSDNDDPNPIVTNNATSFIENGFPLGNTTLLWEVTDNDGLSNYANQLVTIVDTTPPVITLLGDSPITIPFQGSYSYPGATAFDIYDGNLTSSIVMRGYLNTSEPGNQILNYNVKDSSGNEAVTVYRSIIVLQDNGNLPGSDFGANSEVARGGGGGALSADFGKTPYALPTITLTNDSIMNIKLDSKYIEPGFTALDHRGTNLDNFVEIGGSVDTSKVGSYTLTYDVIDYTNQSAIQQTRTVNVVP